MILTIAQVRIQNKGVFDNLWNVIYHHHHETQILQFKIEPNPYKYCIVPLEYTTVLISIKNWLLKNFSLNIIFDKKIFYFLALIVILNVIAKIIINWNIELY